MQSLKQHQSLRSTADGRALQDARSGRVILILILFLCCALAMFLVVGYASGMLGAPNDAPTLNATTHKVRKEQLIVTVVEDGTIESAKNIDVKCEIAGGSTILWIIPDGTVVEAGAELVKLDQSGIEEQLRSQKGIYEKAVASQIQAREDAAAAAIGVEEYLEGVFVKEMQTIEAQIKIALENMRSSENILDHSRRMSRKGFVTPLQVEADEFAVQRAQLDLDAAKTSKSVLEKFTKAKMLKELEGKRDAAKARERSEDANVELESGKLKKLTNQLAKTIIKAPQPGMVVYYKENSRFGGSSSQITEGAAVREAQTIIQLPDLNRMQAKVPIHESKVEVVKSGMRALLKVLDKELQGSVSYVANQPESKSFFQAQVKEYPAVVRIESDAQKLKPGMTADVEILVADLKDVLTLPVGAIVEKGSKHYCWVQKNGQPERRPLDLGLTNDKFVEVKGGVQEGEEVIMNPRAVVADARTEEKDEASKDVDTKAKFGEAKPADPKAPGAGGSAPGGAAGGARPNGPLKVSDYDKDGDGKMSKAEAPEFMQAFFDRVDTDGDGQITQAEATASHQKRLQRMREGGGGAGPGGPPM